VKQEIGLESAGRAVQVDPMKATIDLDDELAAEVQRTASITREEPATVLQRAVRAGLPLVTAGPQQTRPEGYFAEDFENYPEERQRLEEASLKVNVSSER